MAEITAAMVMKLRDETGLPMMECKKALQEAGGDFELAKQKLREIGQEDHGDSRRIAAPKKAASPSTRASSRASAR